jgi:hypothetical protein
VPLAHMLSSRQSISMRGPSSAAAVSAYSPTGDADAISRPEPAPAPASATASSTSASRVGASQPTASSDAEPSRGGQRGYSVGTVLASAGGTSWQDVRSAATSAPQSSCFRTAFLWGAGLAGLFAAHRYKQGGT